MSIIRIFLRVDESMGGMEAHIRWLTDEQRRMGIRCILLMNEGRAEHIDDLHVASNRRYYYTKPAFWGIFLFYFEVIRFLIKQPLTAKALHIHGDWSSFVFAPLLKRLTRSRKVFFSFHGMLHQGFTHRKLLPFFIRFCDKLFVTGYQNYQQLENTGKVVFQPSGIRPVFFTGKIKPSKKNPKKIVTTCVIRPQKNIETILNIARLLPQYHFVIIGDGPDKKRLTNIVKLWQLKNVKFMGYLPPELIVEHLSSSSLFLFTSLEEGTPTAILEAMACGLPIVSTNAGGTESIIKAGTNGFIIKQDYKNEGAYIHLIEAIMLNDNLREQIRLNNLQKSELYKWTEVSKRITAEIMS